MKSPILPLIFTTLSIAIAGCQSSAPTDGLPGSVAHPHDNAAVPTTGPESCGYKFQEDTAENTQAFLHQIQGVWMPHENIWSPEKNTDGTTYYVQTGYGFDLLPAPGKYGPVSFRADEIFPGQQGVQSSKPEYDLTHLRVSVPLTGTRYYDGYRVFETYSDAEGECNTHLLEREVEAAAPPSAAGKETLTVMGNVSTWGGGRRDLSDMIGDGTLGALVLTR